jgi:hypothetical protein
VDLRGSFTRLYSLVVEQLKGAPLSGHLFVFTNRRHGIDPFDYLKDLFTRLPEVKITQIQDFTPAAWANARKREVAQAA